MKNVAANSARLHARQDSEVPCCSPKVPVPQHVASPTMDGCKMNGTLAKSDVTRSESLRLETLDRYQIVDAPPDPAIDDLAELAAKVCNAPVAGVSFALADRIRIRSEERRVGKER